MVGRWANRCVCISKRSLRTCCRKSLCQRKVRLRPSGCLARIARFISRLASALANADLLPDHGFIGAEPYLNGVAQALSHIDEGRLANVRLVHGDALQALARVPDGALTMAYLLHPDPWPKNKHAKRRMMNDGPVRMIADKLKPGGEFRFGTDHAVYLRHALMVMRRFTDEFEWIVDGPADWQNRPSGWCETRYEHKARTKFLHEVWYFRFRRR